MKKQTDLKRLLNRFFIALIITFTYILGIHIPIPLAEITKHYQDILNNTSLSMISGISGTNLQKISIFSVGLSPFMIAILIIQLTSLIKGFNFEALATNHIQVVQQLLVLVLSIVQATTFSLILFKINSLIKLMTVVLILTTGSLLVTWLCIMNVKHGIGGPGPIIIINIFWGFTPYLSKYRLFFTQLANGQLWLSITIIISLVLISFTVAFAYAYYPLKIINTNLLSTDKQVTIPIGLNIGGMMTYMIGIAVLTFPVIIISYLPKDSIFNNICIKIAVCFVLAIILFYLFAYIQFDPYEEAKQLRDNNSYILNIRPGKPTQVYLRRLLTKVALPGAIITALELTLGIVGTRSLSKYGIFSAIPMNISMICFFIIGIKDQVTILLYDLRYDKLTED
ncbi:preprotein translocase subunit SecY [Lactobacillus colini]|uniref:Preprotein translocase subunit SecY n=1 Tax=Lactobacillus colini TaxID=1819254 RepID=A0ABS4MGP1_9LACO|nr:accessory Sec system protein translocase subunit SecY2 [Lactobacillus colini]MBP2058875.1 preprotein translocase subunit SecY [Lactobacillus colini]